MGTVTCSILLDLRQHLIQRAHARVQAIHGFQEIRPSATQLQELQARAKVRRMEPFASASRDEFFGNADSANPKKSEKTLMGSAKSQCRGGWPDLACFHWGPFKQGIWGTSCSSSKGKANPTPLFFDWFIGQPAKYMSNFCCLDRLFLAVYPSCAQGHVFLTLQLLAIGVRASLKLLYVSLVFPGRFFKPFDANCKKEVVSQNDRHTFIHRAEGYLLHISSPYQFTKGHEECLPTENQGPQLKRPRQHQKTEW